MQRISSRDFNQDVSRAKRAAERGPVVITDRGKPAYVLMKHATYRRLAKRVSGVRAMLAQPGGDAIDFEPPRLGEAPLAPPR